MLTQYGPLVEVWFDGAGSEGALVKDHQPQAMIFNMGDPAEFDVPIRKD